MMRHWSFLKESMPLFSSLYQRVLHWSKHPKAPYYLAGLSFVESSVFPIPPDVILAPIVLAKPERAWLNACIATIASVLGGLFGYLLGYSFFALIEPYLYQFGYANAYQQIIAWFHAWGFWIIFLAGFTPIPYKLFTIAAGSLMMPLLPFTFASFVGRAGRFFLVTALMLWGGQRMEHLLGQYIDRIAWATLLVLGIAYVIWRFLHS